MHETGRKAVIDIIIDMDLTFETSKILKINYPNQSCKEIWELGWDNLYFKYL